MHSVSSRSRDFPDQLICIRDSLVLLSAREIYNTARITVLWNYITKPQCDINHGYRVDKVNVEQLFRFHWSLRFVRLRGASIPHVTLRINVQTIFHMCAFYFSLSLSLFLSISERGRGEKRCRTTNKSKKSRGCYWKLTATPPSRMINGG